MGELHGASAWLELGPRVTGTANHSSSARDASVRTLTLRHTCSPPPPHHHHHPTLHPFPTRFVHNVRSEDEGLDAESHVPALKDCLQALYLG